CGWVVARALLSPDEFRSAAWLPWIFAATDFVLRKPSQKRAAALAVVFSLQFYAGEIELFVRTAQVLAPYVLLRAYTLRKDLCPAWKPRILALLFAAVLTAGLCAAQLLPTAETLAQSRRGDSLSFMQAFGGGSESRAVILNELAQGSEHAILFVGVFPLLLALCAFYKPRPEVLFFSGLALISISLLLGDSSYISRLYYQLPMGNWFRFPIRFAPFLVFSITVLSATGLDRLVDQSTLAFSNRQITPNLFFFGGIVAIALVWLYARPQVQPAILLLSGLAAWVFTFTGYRLNKQIYRQGIVLASAAAILAAPWLLINTTPFNLQSTPDLKGIPDELESYIDEHLTAGQRIYMDAALSDTNRVPKVGVMMGVPSITGQSPYTPVTFWNLARPYLAPRLREADESEDISVGLGGGLEMNSGAQELLNMLGVRFVVVGVGSELFGAPDVKWPSTAPESAVELTRLVSHDRFVLYENGGIWPRAFAVSGELPETVEELIRAHDASARPAAIQSYQPHRVEVRLPQDTSGYLVLTDQYFPGWRVSVDNQLRDIQPVADVFRGVRIAEGERAAVFEYRPWSFIIGAMITISALALAALLLTWQSCCRPLITKFIRNPGQP
ncbi:MAG: YfhO family protein, partial [Candidatus Hydrogenedentes bacterium]|nr:YfhO family protein [Candidatus Hydrogenedentota bacterium]